ncbi:NnrU family protein [Niveispirillum sp. KHB5.9]|uniref:NnrU family protein n=1 Tax=Niveispirillum sp. KHB5.9 TaxID=3400269 RepID=UPI003A88743E
MDSVLPLGEFILAFAAFLASHRLPMHPQVRGVLTNRLGTHGFLLAYSALSVLLLGWVFGAAGRAPYIPLWGTSPALAHLALVAMAMAFLLACLTLGRPNPFSFGGARNDHFNPARPGMVRLTRHPLLAALALWSGAHLLANGDGVHVLLFGSFLLFSIAGYRVLDRRCRDRMGPSWRALADAVAAAPLSAALFPLGPTILRAMLAFLLLGLVLLLHPLLFGVDPLGAYFLP